MSVVATIYIIPSYFEKRKDAAYACVGLGESVGLVIYPYILSALLESHDYKHSVLYVCPVFVLTFLAPMAYIPKTDSIREPEGAISLLKSYFRPLCCFISPFYLLQSYCWQAGFGASLLIFFDYVTTNSTVSVAVQCYSILGAGSLLGVFLFLVYLLRFRLNHYALHIVLHSLGGAAVVAISCLNNHLAYYISFAVIGLCLGLIVANTTCITSHLFEKHEIEFMYGSHQIVGGIASVVGPLTTGILQFKYNDLVGLYYITGHMFLGSIAMIIPVVMKPQIWRPKPAAAGVEDRVTELTEGQNQLQREETDKIYQE